MLRRLKIALVFCALASCSSQNQQALSPTKPAQPHYPLAVEHHFTNACLATVKHKAARRTCACSLSEVEQRYSFKEFLAMDARIRRGGKPPALLLKIGYGCAMANAR